MIHLEHSFEIRLAETKDVPFIASMHKEDMKGMLSFLDKEIIALYYQNAIEDKHSCVMLTHEDERIVGVICLAKESFKFHQQILLKHPIALLLLLIKHPFSFKVLFGGFTSSGIQRKTGSELVYLFVTEDNRTKGVGSALFREAINFFMKSGASQFYVVVEQSNSAAISFYEKRGMVFEDRFIWNDSPQVLMNFIISG